MEDPTVVKILQEKGEISDELDYALMNYLIQNRGPGFTACQPSLVELEEGRKVIKMNIDKTFIDNDNQLMSLGIVGKILIDIYTLKVVYCTPTEDLENNVKVLNSAGIDPQPRPRGKY
ncbi:MAG: hypothetical protein ACXABO_03280 [Promethearchaeota archaeon]|jgi:hypothetical protein